MRELAKPITGEVNDDLDQAVTAPSVVPGEYKVTGLEGNDLGDGVYATSAVLTDKEGSPNRVSGTVRLGDELRDALGGIKLGKTAAVLGLLGVTGAAMCQTFNLFSQGGAAQGHGRDGPGSEDDPGMTGNSWGYAAHDFSVTRNQWQPSEGTIPVYLDRGPFDGNPAFLVGVNLNLWIEENGSFSPPRQPQARIYLLANQVSMTSTDFFAHQGTRDYRIWNLHLDEGVESLGLFGSGNFRLSVTADGPPASLGIMKIPTTSLSLTGNDHFANSGQPVWMPVNSQYNGNKLVGDFDGVEIVPEPAGIAALGIGLAGIAAFGKRGRKPSSS